MSAVDRRRFLQASATAAAATVSDRAFGQAPADRLRFALIGGGQQGRLLAGNLLTVSGAELAAVCDINPLNAAAAKRVSRQARVYTDWSELLEQEQDLQAAVVALPQKFQAGAATAALEAGLDVFCEQPMAFSLEEARGVIAARDKHQRVLQIGQQRRCNPVYHLARRMVEQDGAIGEVVRAEAFWDRAEDAKRPLPQLEGDFAAWGYASLDHLVNWRLFRQFGHGPMTEQAVHQLDACGWLLGGKRPKQVCGLGAIQRRDGRETHDSVSADFLYEGDMLLRVVQDDRQGFNYGWSYGELLLGTEGALRVNSEQQLVVYDKNGKGLILPIASLGTLELGGVSSTLSELNAADSNRAGGLRAFSYLQQMRLFGHAVRNRTQPVCTAEMAHNALMTALAGSEAQWNGQYQEFTPQMFV